MKGKRILKLERHIPEFEPGAALRAAVSLEALGAEALTTFGFEPPFDAGQVVLPKTSLGPWARRNFAGYEHVHRDQPMENVVRLVSWRRHEWHGNRQEEVDNFVQRTYRRYPRTYIAGHGIEFEILRREDGARFIASPAFDSGDPKDADTLRVAANILLEGFGEADFVRANLFPAADLPSRRLNWTIFPQGRIPWGQVNELLERTVGAAPESARGVIRARIEVVRTYGPDFVAIGNAGFSGYWVFGFVDSGTYVLESRLLDNATYVLGADWEVVSRLTKADVINSELAVARLIHDNGWTERLERVLRPLVVP